MGEMRRATAREDEARLQDRFTATLVIAASILLQASGTLERPDRRMASVLQHCHDRGQRADVNRTHPHAGDSAPEGLLQMAGAGFGAAAGGSAQAIRI